MTLHTGIINTEDKVRLRKHGKNKSDIKGIKGLQYKVQVLDERLICSITVHARAQFRESYPVVGTRSRTDNNMTGGGETRNKVDIYYPLLVRN